MNTSTINRKIGNLAALLLLLLLSLSFARISIADEGFHGLIESGVLPVMRRGSGSFLAEEDWKEIAAIMEESGRSIPESVASAPSHSKDGLLRALISSELGGTLGEWPVEEQAWYADLLVSLGLSEASELRIPQEGEITREQAVQLAADYLRRAIHTDAPFEDREKFLCTAQYVADSTWRARWYIEFSSRDPQDGAWFQVQLSPHGEIDEAHSGLSGDQGEHAAWNANGEGDTAQHSIEKEEAIEMAWADAADYIRRSRSHR